MRTSTTHPLRIDQLPIANGLIGLTLCPGKQCDSLFGAPWARDLDTDLAVVRAWGTDMVVSLLEPEEFDRLGVPDLGALVEAAGVAWHNVPIRDVDVPDKDGALRWRALSPALHRIVERGGRVLIHCRGGLGRAGTIAALMLIERGHTATDAINAVRAARPGAIETDAQERWLQERAKISSANARALHASLTGCAIGDSLGADIEFLSLSQIRARFPRGLQDLPPHQGLRGAITDDTQMSLFTAEGLIQAHLRGRLKGICHPPSMVHSALLRWLRTQGETPPIETDNKGLVLDPRLNTLRAPGNTCLSSLRTTRKLGSAARNASKGCGSIMRVSPAAHMVPHARVREMAMETSALTHGHPTAQIAAAAWAEMLADVAQGQTVDMAARQMLRQYAALPDSGETLQALRSALHAPRDGRPETVETLGAGWTADEALSIALYACLCAESLTHGLRIAATHGGDSDSTGAIAGAMLGLMFREELPGHPWAETTECADVVFRLARDFDSLGDCVEESELLGP